MNDDIRSLEMKVDTLAKKLGSVGTAGTVAGRNSVEKQYAVLSQQLLKARHSAGLLGYMSIKKKYRKGL